MPMEIDLGPAAAFRDELREWMEANRPADPEAARSQTDRRRPRATAVGRADSTRRGYLCVSWPNEYGGRGLDRRSRWRS